MISGGVYFRHDLSILVPHDAEVPRRRRRLAAARPRPTASFDEPAEGWTLTTGPLTTGHHVARARGDHRRDGRPDQRPVGRPHAGRPRAGHRRRLHEDGARRSTAGAGRHGSTCAAPSAGLPVPRLAPRQAGAPGRRQGDEPRSTTGENGVWTGTLKPARTRTYEVRFAGAGQFQGLGASGPRHHHRQVGHALHSPDARAERA